MCSSDLAGACLVTDRWSGIEDFFEPGREILVADSAGEIVNYLRTVSAAAVRGIGARMRERALRDHTYELRAQQVDSILQTSLSRAAGIGPRLAAKELTL